MNDLDKSDTDIQDAQEDNISDLIKALMQTDVISAPKVLRKGSLGQEINSEVSEKKKSLVEVSSDEEELPLPHSYESINPLSDSQTSINDQSFENTSGSFHQL